ncbi:MAG: molybdenum cofactor guanylyltransferase [Marinospirillum sp.]|uniref:molybdenum cofactor guanylyltransferase MobA n=1 Tax=Marinospirillum sp. TaxID=2183934 RepID=UPI0019E3EA38|nr:molybdenum cofactor guanylyltransferase MobA [Marinospirillum sp.]MBE0507213.1 molybdenum cofactor guanylyltransferase [Marinospirillum sp.]
MTQPTLLPICGVILAGGEGRRMGGQDKGWVDYQGQPLIQHVIQRLQPQLPDLLINANRNLTDYQTLGYPVVSDIEQGFHGPLMGILTGLKASSQEWTLFVPCDGPFLPEKLAERLYQAAITNACDIAVASDGEWLQPVVVLIRSQLATQLEQAMLSGERKPDRWYASRGMTQVVFDADSLRNFNKPDEMV